MKESFSPLYDLDSHGSTVSLKKFGGRVSDDEADVKFLLVSNLNHANVSVSNFQRVKYCRFSIIYYAFSIWL